LSKSSFLRLARSCRRSCRNCFSESARSRRTSSPFCWTTELSSCNIRWMGLRSGGSTTMFVMASMTSECFSWVPISVIARRIGERSGGSTVMFVTASMRSVWRSPMPIFTIPCRTLLVIAVASWESRSDVSIVSVISMRSTTSTSPRPSRCPPRVANDCDDFS